MEIVPALSSKPVFIDGLTNTLAYAVLAVKTGEVYNCVCLSSYGTFKFYPNFEFWGLTAVALQNMGLHHTYNRAPYQGVHNASTEGIKRALAAIREQRGVVVVPDDMIEGVFETPMAERMESRVLHPATRGQRPASLLSLTEILALPNRRADQLLLAYNPSGNVQIEAGPAEIEYVQPVDTLVVDAQAQADAQEKADKLSAREQSKL